MSIEAAAFYAVLALVCAFTSGFLLCQYLSGWTGESDQYGGPLSDEWMPGRVIEK